MTQNCLSEPVQFPFKMMRKVALVRFHPYSHFDENNKCMSSSIVSIIDVGEFLFQIGAVGGTLYGGLAAGLM